MAYVTEFSGDITLSDPLPEEVRDQLKEWLDSRHEPEETGIEYGWYTSIQLEEDGKCLTISDSNNGHTEPEWLKHIIEKFMKPNGVVLSGEVTCTGSEAGDYWFLLVEDNVVTTEKGKLVVTKGNGEKINSLKPKIIELCRKLLDEKQEEIDSGIEDSIYKEEENEDGLTELVEMRSLVDLFEQEA